MPHSMPLFVFMIMSLACVYSPLQAQEYVVEPGKPPAFARVIENPELPRVLIIGDSISIGYTPALRTLLQGKANVHRIPVNGGPTTRGLEQIEEWLGESSWDVIHFNWGLHDLRFVDENRKSVPVEQGQHQVPLDQYEQNLNKLVSRLKQTGATLIWRNTTPVPLGSNYRIEGDEVSYNRVAERIMQKNKIAIDDHHTFVMQHGKELQRPADVHFTAEGSRKLAELAAQAIQSQLPAR
ncbi:MAG: SGNH/GDSL hydrolase family protein [Planctomycetaceae bacterium]|nr:SGNH/GDSL hydrolase family protein [Planctomycetaceae bacterium]